VAIDVPPKSTRDNNNGKRERPKGERRRADTVPLNVKHTDRRLCDTAAKGLTDWLGGRAAIRQHTMHCRRAAPSLYGEAVGPQPPPGFSLAAAAPTTRLVSARRREVSPLSSYTRVPLPMQRLYVGLLHFRRIIFFQKMSISLQNKRNLRKRE